MENKYLEKIAANRLKQHLMGQGASFGDSRTGGATNQSINLANGAGTAPTATFNTGDKSFKGVKGTFAKMTGRGPINTGTTRVTGDTLAGGTKAKLDSMRKATGGGPKPIGPDAFKTTRGAAAKPASEGVLGAAKDLAGKAIGLAKRNPLATGAAVLGTGLLAHKAMSNGDQNQYQGQY